MSRMELSETLGALVAGLDVPELSGLLVTEASVEAPLEISISQQEDGLLLMAGPPSNVMRTGFEAVAHRVRLRAGPVEDTENPTEIPPGGVSDGAGQ